MMFLAFCTPKVISISQVKSTAEYKGCIPVQCVSIAEYGNLFEGAKCLHAHIQGAFCRHTHLWGLFFDNAKCIHAYLHPHALCLLNGKRGAAKGVEKC